MGQDWAHSPDARRGKSARAARGFTLIELIAVIIILGILAGFIVPQYLNVTASATSAATKAAASEANARLRSATNIYLVRNSAMPTSLNDIASSSYLGLDGANSVSIGDYAATYTQVSSNSTVTIEISSQATGTVLYTTNNPWP